VLCNLPYSPLMYLDTTLQARLETPTCNLASAAFWRASMQSKQRWKHVCGATSKGAHNGSATGCSSSRHASGTHKSQDQGYPERQACRVADGPPLLPPSPHTLPHQPPCTCATQASSCVCAQSVERAVTAHRKVEAQERTVEELKTQLREMHAQVTHAQALPVWVCLHVFARKYLPGAGARVRQYCAHFVFVHLCMRACMQVFVLYVRAPVVRRQQILGQQGQSQRRRVGTYVCWSFPSRLVGMGSPCGQINRCSPI